MCLVFFMSVACDSEDTRSPDDEQDLSKATYEEVVDIDKKDSNSIPSLALSRERVRRSDISRSHPARINLSYTIRRLKLCGWYWGDITSDQAKRILRKAQNGSFILRDSTDACHLFTLSLKANNIVVSVRVAFSRGMFKLDSWNQEDSPSFNSVVDLIDYYLEDERREFYVELPKVGEFPVCLKHPILKEVPMLQHLCRTTIARYYEKSELRLLPLPMHLIRYVDVLYLEDHGIDHGIDHSVNGSDNVESDSGETEVTPALIRDRLPSRSTT